MPYGPLVDIGVNLTVPEYAGEVDGIICRSRDAGQSTHFLMRSHLSSIIVTLPNMSLVIL